MCIVFGHVISWCGFTVAGNRFKHNAIMQRCKYSRSILIRRMRHPGCGRRGLIGILIEGLRVY